MQRLGAWLLGPVWRELVDEPIASGAPSSVVVAPTGVLWSVPFHAIGCDGVSLIDLAVVTTAPSLSVHVSRPVAPVPSRSRALVVGVSGAGVPGAATEATQIAAVRSDCLVLLEGEATLARVVGECSRAAVVHLATHGVFRHRAPLQSGVRLADGWLTSHRAASLQLDGALVVLSACDTGRAAVADGEEVLGAQYGYFRAGARSIVMSLWPAHDDRTVELMRDFHAAHAGGEAPAVALRAAQLALRDREPHPWWWAAFTISGAG